MSAAERARWLMLRLTRLRAGTVDYNNDAFRDQARVVERLLVQKVNAYRVWKRRTKNESRFCA